MRRPIGILALAALLAGCTVPAGRSAPAESQAVPARAVVDPAPTSTGGDDVSGEPLRGVAAALEPADDCDVLLDYFVERALDQVGPWGLPGTGGGWIAASDGAEAEASSDTASGGPEPSATNVQVEGVDEGDFVKAVGDHLYVLTDGRFRVFDTSDGLEETAALEMRSPGLRGQMLVSGDRVAIVGAGAPDHPASEAAMDIAPVGSPTTDITLVDVSDPTRPEVVSRLTVDGHSVSTRLVEDRLRVVLEAHPVGLEWSQPQGSGLRAEREATERNREVVRESSMENWLPWYVSDGGDEGTALACNDVLLPPDPSGLGTLSILDFDLEAGIDEWEAASVVASGTTVYANTERTYVATQRWVDRAAAESEEVFEGHVTRIHRFDTPVDGALRYAASGDVDGFLLDQFAMDEHDGHLRVASTTAPRWWGGGEDSVSRVTVLEARDGRLQRVGRVGGLGETETIQAVRFMGPVGYVVTFRQVDPLYVIDLSDPSDPEEVGELKIPGFSAYLHPLEEGLLLGVGQDADPETGVTEGLQLSLFDVSDPTSPERVDTFSPAPWNDDADQAEVWSPVQNDHKAFTLAGERGYVPFHGWWWREAANKEEMVTGVVQVDWAGASLDSSRVIDLSDGQGERWMSPERVVVKGDVAYVIGHGGIDVVDLPSGEVVDTVGF